MVLDPIPQSLPVHFFGSRPQPPTSRCYETLIERDLEKTHLEKKLTECEQFKSLIKEKRLYKTLKETPERDVIRDPLKETYETGFEKRPYQRLAAYKQFESPTKTNIITTYNVMLL